MNDTAQFLRTRIGFFPPARFVKIVTAFANRVGDVEGGLTMLEDYIGLGSAICDSTKCRYEVSPIEFLPFLPTGGDGCMYGYVVHAPELNLPDYPMAGFCPMEGEGVVHIGDSTTSAIENLISYTHADDEFTDIDLEFVRQLGLNPSPDKADNVRKLVDDDTYVRPRIELPTNWKHVMTSDGVGVVAEERRFRPGDEGHREYQEADIGQYRTGPGNVRYYLGDLTPVADYVVRAKQETAEGFAASALITLKEAWKRKYNSGEPLSELKAALAGAYEALEKTTLSDALRAYYTWI